MQNLRVLQDMSATGVINQIIADASGTDAEKAKFILSQQVAFGLDEAEWRSLLQQVPKSVRQEVGEQMSSGDAPNTVLMMAL